MEENVAQTNMSDEYHKARKFYGLFSGILLAWEYVGIKFESNLNVPIVNTSIKLKSPEVISIVILILIFYFSFRFIVEWIQSPNQSRMKGITLIDFIVAHLIGVSAIVLFAVQQLFTFRLAQVSSPFFVVGLFFGLPSFFILLALFISIEDWLFRSNSGWMFLITILTTVSVYIVIAYTFFMWLNDFFSLFAGVIVILILILIFWGIYFLLSDRWKENFKKIK